MTIQLEGLELPVTADLSALAQGAQIAVQTLAEIEAGANSLEQELSALSANVFGILQQSGDEALEALGGTIFDFVQSGKLRFGELRDVAVNALASISQTVLTSFADNLLSGFGSGLFGSFLSGLLGFQRGGPTSPFQPYIVGEQGPELFVPKVGGQVLPNGTTLGRPQSSPQIIININGNADQDMMRRSSAQITRAVRRAMAAEG